MYSRLSREIINHEPPSLSLVSIESKNNTNGKESGINEPNFIEKSQKKSIQNEPIDEKLSFHIKIEKPTVKKLNKSIK